MKITEKGVQLALANYYIREGYEVRREVETPVGYIDLIVYGEGSKRIIEVKERGGIKHAIGQVISYAEYHKDCTGLGIVYFSYDGRHKRIDSSYRNNGRRLGVEIESINNILETEEILRWQEQVTSAEKDPNYLQTLIMDLSQVSLVMKERQEDYQPGQEILTGELSDRLMF